MLQSSPASIVLAPRTCTVGDPVGGSLENINTSVVADGALCYVSAGAGQGEWQLQKTATDTPDGVTIVAPVSGPGRWFIKLFPGPNTSSPIYGTQYQGIPLASFSINTTTFTESPKFSFEMDGVPAGEYQFSWVGTVRPTDNTAPQGYKLRLLAGESEVVLQAKNVIDFGQPESVANGFALASPGGIWSLQVAAYKNSNNAIIFEQMAFSVIRVA